MKAFNQGKEYYVLAVSQNDVRVLQCTFDIVAEVVVKGLPKKMAEVTGNDSIEKQLQSHSSTGQSDRTSKSIYHGHGVGEDHHKDNILHYFQRLDKELHVFLRDKKSPLILFCVDYLQPIFKDANTYPNLLEDFIVGNPDKLSEKDIHTKSVPVARKYFNSLDIGI